MTRKTFSLAIDIGGTFTDVVLDQNGKQTTTKVLTRYDAPEVGVMDGIASVLVKSGIVDPGTTGEALPIDCLAGAKRIIHGTTLATNALIERKGAKTALITTKGHRDTLEMAHENRFAQYDINVDRAAPLVPRHLRFPVEERMDKDGKIRLPLAVEDVERLIPDLRSQQVESVAIGLLHAYANPANEMVIEESLRQALPDLAITRASEVCPEIREYERQSTAVANAYVQPLMAKYLTGLKKAVAAAGAECPFFLMTSAGGLCDLETAIRFPIRLVESGPAGGVILASTVARQINAEEVMAFDMGGTTAKLCLIDEGKPLMSRTFEVDRSYRFQRGSGLPIRVPVIELVEIGAGGGSIAHVDQLGRIQVGPGSAGSTPGPACFDRGGEEPCVTDANVMLGRLDVSRFAGGSFALNIERAAKAIERQIASPAHLTELLAAHAVSEIVEENMANAARVHATEWGREVEARTLIAFGGGAPLHAAHVANKLGLSHVVIPANAGVGSAVGFLQAPLSFEVVRSRHKPATEVSGEWLTELM
ncbi:MAG: hydantoinase/oxoprolinase family protein [Pseudomonadota bacterium]